MGFGISSMTSLLRIGSASRKARWGVSLNFPQARFGTVVMVRQK